MSKFDERLEEELAKLEKQKKKKKKTTDLTNGRLSYLPSANNDDDDDIGPVHSGGGGKIPTKEENAKDIFGLDLFQKGAFDDGYQFGDFTKTLLGTVGDIGLGAVKGAANTVGGIVDLAQYGVAGVADLLGADDFAKKQRQWANKDIVNSATKSAEEFLDDYSILGRTSTSVTEGLGQVGTMILTGGLGKAAGLGNAGVTALTSGSMFASGMGSGMSEAYGEGATDGEALAYGTISGAADALSEMLFGGLGKGLNATGFNKGLLNADDLLAKKVSGLFKNHLTKNLAEYGIKAGAEGFEEVIAGIAQAGGKKLTYMSDEDFLKLLEDENLLEQFVVGSVVSGIAQAKGVHVANKTETDFVTGMTKNEQSVVKKETENRIAEAEADGTKLTNKEKAAIEAQVEKDLEKGYISTDTIEEVLGGETYKSYKDTIDSEDALFSEADSLQEEFDKLNKIDRKEMAPEQVKREAELESLLSETRTRVEDTRANSQRNQLKERLSSEVMTLAQNDRLIESYNERTRRTQAFEADLSKYDAKQQAVIRKAAESGILNNTNRTHEFVDMVAKISADKGVLFDFTNNAKLKESGFAVDGRVVNGYVTKDGITINVQSAKSLNSLVGHEITHVLEGTDLYKELQGAVLEYAMSKNDYTDRYNTLAEMYKNIEGANVYEELTADLVGDYLFTDQDFINNLSTNHRNVFQKIYDEVKYLLKVVTAGSKEARQLEKVKRAFEKAYKADTNTKTEVKTEGETMIDPENDSDLDYESPMKYSVSVTDPDTIDFLENQEHITTYKAMVLIDGKLYPPMASKVKGEDGKYRMTNPRDLGEWQQATEDTTNIKFNDKGIGYYDLKKDDGGTVRAAYNPYEHSSNLVLNDQFEAAYKRDNLVTVECEIPVSEMSSGYRAEHAKDSVGMMDWHSGVVAGKLKDNKRMVYLSRYLKAVRILSDAETAVKFKEIVGDTPVPFNVVSPGLLAELEKIGVTIDYNGSPQYQYLQRKAAEREAKKAGKAKYSLSDSTGRQLSQEQQEYFKDSVIRDKDGNLMVLYHGTQNAFTVFDIGRSGENYDGWSEYGEGIYLTPENKTAQYYGDNAGRGREVKLMEVYADIKNPFSTNDPVDFDISDLTKKYELTDFDERFMKKYGNRLIEFLNHHNESVRDYLTGKGFDGVWETIDGDVYQVIAYAENQVKNTDNTKPTENPDIRYSLSEDSDGNRLTKEQEEYFKSSKVRDAEGNLKVMYHGSKDGGFHVFDRRYSDDHTSFFFVDSNDVASSYSGTSETYEAKTIRTAEDMNNFLAEIGYDHYKAVEKDGKFELLEDGDHVATRDTAQGIYEEFCWYEGVGDGDVNYKVYLNLENPLEVDANGREWNEIKIPEEHREKFNKIIFRINHPRSRVDTATTRNFAEYANAQGYDGVIFKNILDVGGYGGRYDPHTVAIAFNSNQIKSTANTQPTGDPDIRYSLSEDSNGRKLSPGQSEYFKDSKALDSNGNLQIVYHGTQNADFTVFKRNVNFFTDNKEMADSYSPNGAMYEGYVNITKPYEIDAAGEKWSKIPIDDETKAFLQEYGSSVFMEGGKWRTTTNDLASAIEEAVDNGDMDYDGIIIRNIDDTGSYYKGKDSQLATDYIVFNSNQFKNADNQNPTSDRDIRFSLSESVEETKDLMALHNLRSEELLKTLDLGGLAMPSIAIIKANSGHDQYGDVSIVLPKESIDPKASRYNKVYGGDAWTPTHPKLEYKPSAKVEKRISDKYYELSGKIGYDATRPMYRYVHELEESLNRDGGEAGMLDRIYDDTDMMQVYLEDSGKGKVEPIVKETRTELSEAEADMQRFMVDALGEDILSGFKTPVGENPSAYRRAFMDAHETEIREAYKRLWAEKFNFTEEQIENILANTNKGDLMKVVRNAYMYTQNNGVKVTTETDYEATRNAIREKAEDGFKAWVDDLFKGVEERTGIRNNVELFTNSGNRRGWDALHWENTLENVVKAMRAQDQTGADAFSPTSAIFAVAHKQYGDISEIKADSGRLGRVSEEEYKALEDSYASRLVNIANDIKDPSERNPYIAADQAASLIVDAVRNYKTKAGMLRFMQKWNNRVTSEVVDDIVSLVNDIANMPTGYFEAKPQRAVSFDEVGVFVIPYDADVKLKQELLNRGYNIAEYDPNVEGDRTRVLNNFEEYMFSLSNVGEQQRTFGKYNVYGSDIALPSAMEEIAPTAQENRVVETVSERDIIGTPATEEEVSAYGQEMLDYASDADAPPEIDAPYFEDSQAEVEDPFEDRDWFEVSKDRKTPAYMYENPEVKPFFQDEAQKLLDEYNSTIRGERFWTEEGGYSGVSRMTSKSMETLLDEWNMRYDDIEKGLKAIIEDNGAENIAAAKKIEFMLNDRLLNGYEDFWTKQWMPPSQEYIQALEEKQIT